MLGDQRKQLCITDIENWCKEPIVSSESIYGLLAYCGERLIRDDDFAEMYSHTGRPSISPALLAKVAGLVNEKQKLVFERFLRLAAEAGIIQNTEHRLLIPLTFLEQEQ